MTTPSTLLKAAVLVLLAVLAAIFAPLFPNPSVPGDPIALPDSRVETPLSETDIAEILRLVRGGRHSSAYQRHWVQTDLPLRSISTAQPSLRLGPDRKTTEVLSPGEIQATFSTGTHPELQEGVTYYFSKGRDGWRITKIKRWAA